MTTTYELVQVLPSLPSLIPVDRQKKGTRPPFVETADSIKIYHQLNEGKKLCKIDVYEGRLDESYDLTKAMTVNG